MGWIPLSLTAYLLELESIWEQTNNQFWKRKISILSASRGIYYSAMWDSYTCVEQAPRWIKTNSLISCSSPSSPCCDRNHHHCQSAQDLTAWRGMTQKGWGVKWLPLHSANQLRMRGATGEDTVKRWDCGWMLLQCRLAQIKLHSTIAVK